MKRVTLAAAILGLTGAVALAHFGHTLGAFFVSDDFAWLDCAADACADPRHILTLHISHFFRPLSHLAFAALFCLVGRSPLAFRIAGILWHGLVTTLFGRLVASVSRDRWLGLCSALILVLVPLYSDVLIWVSASTESISAAAMLFSLGGFLRYLAPSTRNRRRWTSLVIALTGFTLALAAKESAVTLLPLMALLHGWIALEGRSRPVARLWTYLPFVVILAGYLVLQVQLQRTSHLVTSGVYELGPHVAIRIGTSFWHLLNHTWPLLLATLVGVLVLKIPLAAVLTSRTIARACLVLGLVLIPMIPYVPFKGRLLPNRYLYLPAMGLALALALAARFLITAEPKRIRLKVLAALALAGLALQGVQIAGEASRKHLKLAHETRAFVLAAAGTPAPRRPVLVQGSPLRGQHLSGAMRLFHPTRSRAFLRSPGGHAYRSVWRWDRASQTLDLVDLVPKRPQQ